MTPNERLLVDTIKVTLATYVETRRRTRDDVHNAVAELKRFLPKLIDDGINDRTQLVVKALVRLRELEARPAPVPVWMRRRAEIAGLGGQRRPQTVP
jgi:hypothetical protein